MSLQSVTQQVFSFAGLPPVVVEPCDAQLSSDAGLLPIRQLDERLGLTAQFAAAITDVREAAKVQHADDELVRCRVYGILADYEDQNDHDALRSDPVFKLLAGRRPTDDDLAGQPTHSRFENAIDVPALLRLRDVWIDQFIAGFDAPPARLTFDIDPFDDPTHGRQPPTSQFGTRSPSRRVIRTFPRKPCLNPIGGGTSTTAANATCWGRRNRRPGAPG